MEQELSLPYFHIESFGAVDGPGTRLVVFSQGCFLRCVYCHNPESWDLNRNKLITVKEVLDKYERNKEFYAKGGITISGGEPTIHSKFIIELFKECKKRNIHTCIDTCGFTFKKESTDRYAEMDEYTDLWIVDVKHIDREGHKKVTGFADQRELDLIRWLESRESPYWCRQVILRNYTNKKEHLIKLGEFLKGLHYMKKFEVLPFHNMAEVKYDELKMDYPLKGEPGATRDDTLSAMKWIKQGMGVK